LAEAARLGDWSYLAFMLRYGYHECPLGLRNYAADIFLGRVKRPDKKTKKLMNFRHVLYAMEVHELEGAKGRDAAVEAVAKKYRVTSRTVRTALQHTKLRRGEDGKFDLVSYALPEGAFPWLLRSSFFPWDGWEPEPYGAWTVGGGLGSGRSWLWRLKEDTAPRPRQTAQLVTPGKLFVR
jgi:hypothetical protein